MEQFDVLERDRDDANDDVDFLEDELSMLQKDLDQKQHALDYAPPFRVNPPPQRCVRRLFPDHRLVYLQRKDLHFHEDSHKEIEVGIRLEFFSQRIITNLIRVLFPSNPYFYNPNPFGRSVNFTTWRSK